VREEKKRGRPWVRRRGGEKERDKRRGDKKEERKRKVRGRACQMRKKRRRKKKLRVKNNLTFLFSISPTEKIRLPLFSFLF
jgi:hypothetical protein